MWRGTHGSVQARRVMTIMASASASGTLIPAIAAIARLWSLRKLAGYLAGRDWPVRIGRERAAKVEGPLSQRVAQFERSESWTGSRWLRHPDLCRKENQQRSRW